MKESDVKNGENNITDKERLNEVARFKWSRLGF